MIVIIEDQIIFINEFTIFGYCEELIHVDINDDFVFKVDVVNVLLC